MTESNLEFHGEESHKESPQALRREELKEKFSEDLEMTWMRHGDPKYSEKENNEADFEGKLTENGKKQVEASALELAQDILQKNQIALVWSSPRARTKESTEILLKVFKSQGVEVIDRTGHGKSIGEAKEIGSLSAPKMTKEFWDKKPADEFFVRLWLEMSEQGNLPEGVETPDEFSKKFQRVIEYQKRIAKLNKEHIAIHPENVRKIRIINVAHFETPIPLLLEAYGDTLEGDKLKDKEGGLEGGAYFNVGMQLTDDEDNPAILKVDYKKGPPQDETGSRETFVIFNKNRELHKIK